MTAPTTEKLASLVYQQFELLPKTGKPPATQWTILSAIILHTDEAEVTNETQVIAIGCGTKCIGKQELCHRGLILNDSHAEVLARRAFLRYIYHHLHKAVQGDPLTANNDGIFLWDPQISLFRLRPQLTFHFLTTHTPCGDACISSSKAQQKPDYCDKPPVVKKLKTSASDGIEVHKNYEDRVGYILGSHRKETTNTTVYTGAKLIGLNSQQDAMRQIIGAVRTKPGRGDRTLSMSCSDKLARWNLLGVQGALIDALLAEPIYFSTLNFSDHGDIKGEEEALRRAIFDRFKGRRFITNRYKVQKPEIRLSQNTIFAYARNAQRQSPASTGLSWCKISERFKPYEVIVNGKRQGVTKKKSLTPQAALKTSKYHLMAEFLKLLALKPELLEKFNLKQKDIYNLKYKECKLLAKEYQEAWKLAKEIYFRQWTQKPNDILEFGLATQAT